MMPDLSDTKVAERLARIESAVQTIIEQGAHTRQLAESVTRMQERAEQQTGNIEILFDKARAAEQRQAATDGKVDKWINRGVGAYAAASFLIVIVGSLLWRIVGEYESAIRASRETLITIDRRVTWLEFESKGRLDAIKQGSSK